MRLQACSYDALRLMIFQLQCAKSDQAPTWPNQKKHLQRTLKATRKLEVLLRPQWLAAKMRLFEDLELRQQTFGIRGVINLKTRADFQKLKRDGPQSASALGRRDAKR